MPTPGVPSLMRWLRCLWLGHERRFFIGPRPGEPGYVQSAYYACWHCGRELPAPRRDTTRASRG